MSTSTTLFYPIQLERPVHAGGGDVLSVLAEAHARGGRRVIVKHLELLPLPAQVHSHVRTRDGQVRPALVEAQLLDSITLVQLDRFEVLQLTQIP